jgi:hypothetical protein
MFLGLKFYGPYVTPEVSSLLALVVLCGTVSASIQPPLKSANMKAHQDYFSITCIEMIKNLIFSLNVFDGYVDNCLPQFFKVH